MIQASSISSKKSLATQAIFLFLMALGSFLAAFSIEVFLVPNRLIDGGIVGIAMMSAYLAGQHLFPFFLIIFNLPFLYLAYKNIGKHFLVHMLFALAMMAISVLVLQQMPEWHFSGGDLEVVVIGGTILGIGIGLVIRYGGCLDGTEILGIIINRRTGITVGQVVLFCNVFIFGAAGFVFQDWHPPLLSLIMYIVVVKVMDAVIVGLDETKSVLIISAKSQQVAKAIIHELKLGLTIMYGRGGYSGEEREILYVICERLQLAELKELIHREDPMAFIAIENLHEVSNSSMSPTFSGPQKKIEKLMTSILKPRNQ